MTDNRTAPPGWQPIETAPRDVPHIRGMWVVSNGEERWFAAAGYVDTTTDVGEDGEDVVVAETFNDMSGEDTGWAPEDYTHWLPLPSPPGAVEPDLLGFAHDIMSHWPEGGVDGFDLQDIAARHGLLLKVPGGFDPARHEDRLGVCDPGDDFWVLNLPPADE